MERIFTVGDTLHGFEVISKRNIPDYRAEGILFRHKSGFEVYLLSNDDGECFFTYTIYTPPKDNSGVFHILEHTLLTGSEKYPVRDPFMTMIRNSCNTFLNAMTGPDRTYFPAASPVKKDFDNIFNVYTDAVFSPLLRKTSFEQEGIRLSAKGGLHFEGIVFSEMQGDISQHDSVVSNSASRPLFSETSPYRYEFGGNPPDICDLTYEEFVNTYKKYYVPANMTLFLYGNLDIEEKLSYLDENYLSNRQSGEKIKRIERESHWTMPRSYRATSNADEDTISSTTMLSWLLGESENPDLNTELSLVVDILLGSPGSPLYKAIINSGFGRDLSSESGMSDSFRELIFSVGIDGTAEKDLKKIEQYIVSALKSIVEKGLDPVEIEAAIRRKEFQLQELPSGMPLGYTLFFSRIDKGWAYGKDPSDMLDSKVAIKRIRKEWEEDKNYFENWISKNIIDNSHRLLSVTVMDKDTQKKLLEEIDKKVEEHKSDYSKSDEEEFLHFEAEEDKGEDIEKLPRLYSSDIPNERLDYTHVLDDRIIATDFPSGGIVYGDMAFDVTDFSYEELEDLSLLSRLILMTNVGDKDYSQFLTQLRFTTGAANFSLEAGSTEKGEEKVYLFARFKSLFEYYNDALRLFKALFTSADLHSKDRIKAALSDIDSDFQSYVARAGHQFAMGNASSTLNSSLYTTERIMGIDYWYRVAKMLKDEVDILPERLEHIYRKVFVENRLYFHISADKENLDKVSKATKEFIATLERGTAVCSSPRKFEPFTKYSAYTFSTPVNYIGLTFKCGEQDTKEGSAEKMLLSICSKNSLWSFIREKGGAYGVGGATDSVEVFSYIYTYRDPRIDGSIEDFKRAIEEEKLTSAKLEDGRLAVLSRDVKPSGPGAKAMIDFRRFLYGITDELRHKRKDSMLSLTLEDLEKSRSTLLSRLEGEVSITVLADLKSLDKSTYDFEVNALPFK